jgi:hypothetical protein
MTTTGTVTPAAIAAVFFFFGSGVDWGGGVSV